MHGSRDVGGLESSKMRLQVALRVGRDSKVAAPNQDMNWIVRNYDWLRGDYPDKWVAVKDKKIVDSDSDLEPLLRRLKEKRGTAIGYATEFVATKPRNIILRQTVVH